MINVIGEVNIDYVLKNSDSSSHLNLGGVFHACKALWALNVEFSLNFIAPSYLVNHIFNQSENIKPKSVKSIGLINDCPNILVISHPEEARNQGYDFLLIESAKMEIYLNEVKDISKDDCLVFVTSTETAEIAFELQKERRVSIDVTKLEVCEYLQAKKVRFCVVFVSNSSEITKQFPVEEDLLKYMKGIADTIVYKQNRGGTCIYSDGNIYRIPAFLTDDTVHSIGVGDVFNATFISFFGNRDIEDSGKISSHVSRRYSETYQLSLFQKEVQNFFKYEEANLQLKGTIVPWDYRKTIQIYIAGPDFSYRDTKFINEVCDGLLYHNFKVFRPILQNGELKISDPESKREETFHKDLEAINESEIILAVHDDYNDPGTLIEIGFAWGQGKHVIVFDPLRKANNPMLVFGPSFISSSLHEVINSVFLFSSRLYEAK